jgi:hypothetical protein
MYTRLHSTMSNNTHPRILTLGNVNSSLDCVETPESLQIVRNISFAVRAFRKPAIPWLIQKFIDTALTEYMTYF